MFQNQALKQQAQERVAAAKLEKKIILFYAGSLAALSVASLLANLLIDRVMPQTGGLSTMGLRSFFSTLTSILPVVTSLLTMCLGFGYMGGMVRVSRGQYASPNALRTGFERFWPLLRLALLKGLLVLAASIAASYLATFIFILSPFSNRFLSIVEPMISGGSLLSEGTLVLDPGMAESILAASVPMLMIFLIVSALLVVPLLYRLRMTDYILYDHPEVGALYAIRESKRMMRGNRLAMFKLDLSFWWFYLAWAASYSVSYAAPLLALAGIQLPVSGDVSTVIFFLLSCAGEFAVSYYLRNRVEVTYALAYNALKPEEASGGAVLGNIFQM